jgi:hypothetical protein
MDDQGGWLWALIDVGFVLVLAAAIIYGITTWRRRRNPTLERIRDDATRRAYEEPSGRAQSGRTRAQTGLTEDPGGATQDPNRSDLNAGRRRASR